MLAEIVFAIGDLSVITQTPPQLNPNSSAYPESSLVDRSSLLDAPAGRHGFVTAKNGRFYFSDGTRARFFGLNLAKDTVFIKKSEIDKLVEVFAHSGINLVRIHHIDDVQGLLDPNVPGSFRADKLDLVDYWIAKLKERGIYLCLDLNDYRTFHASEGVKDGEALGRGAKPYAVFDQRLIELQQIYARQFLLEHVNPYTKLCYAQDPAIALLEIYDENGLFIRRDDWNTLLEPYKTALLQQWNAWLRYRYGTTAALKSAWTNANKYCALLPKESLEQATVRLPNMTLLSNPPSGAINVLQAPVRVSDGALFAYETQVNYLQLMMSYLHEIGVKIPITAVGAQDVLPDLMATATSTDYIGINFYWDHPAFSDGSEWRLPYYFSQMNPLVDNNTYAFPATVSQSRMQGKPLVVRELEYCYPNLNRGVGTLEAAAYGAFLDIDALILFTYDASTVNHTIGYFDIHLDPLRWGLVSQASRLFLSGEIQPAKHTVAVGYSQVDAFTWESYQSPLYQLAYAVKVVNYTEPATQHPYDLLISSGRSCGERWTGKKLLLFANKRQTSLRFQHFATGMDALAGYQLQEGKFGAFNFTFAGIGYDAGAVKSMQVWPSYLTADLKTKGLQPIATNGAIALGMFDQKRKILCFRTLPDSLVLRVALDVLHDWQGSSVSHNDLDQSRWRSENGQLERNVLTKQLTIDTPTIQALAGNLSTPAHTSALKISTATEIGAIIAESLDEKALNSSEKILVKMVTRARNDNMVITSVKGGPKEYRLTAIGEPPILTDGNASSIPTQVSINGKLLIELGLRNGSWEYLYTPTRALLYLDTPNITVKVPSQPKLVRFYGATVREEKPTENFFTVPAGIKLTEILW